MKYPIFIVVVAKLALVLNLGNGVIFGNEAHAADENAEIPIVWNPDDPKDSPKVFLKHNGQTRALLLDTGTYPTLIFESARSNIDAGENKQLIFSEEFAIEKHAIIPNIPHPEFSNYWGILSPQSLTCKTKVIDFEAKKLTCLPLSTKHAIELHLVKTYKSIPFPARWVGNEIGAIFVNVSIGSGGQESRLFDIDTGKNYSSYAFLRDINGVKMIGNGPNLMDVQGNKTSHMIASESVPYSIDGIFFGGAKFIEAKPKTSGGLSWYGNLGMDVFKSLVIVIPPKTLGTIYLVRSGQSTIH